MIVLIVFSYNRALQLEALLRSIETFWECPKYRISVVYNTSCEDFQKGYEILKEQYPYVNFLKESPSKGRWPLKDYFSLFNVKKLLKYKNLRKHRTDFRDIINSILSSSSSDYAMFLTDDSVFVRKVNIPDADLEFIQRDQLQNQISLRLGKDITEKPEGIQAMPDGKFIWNFSRHRDARSWGYNFSVDAHVYSINVALKLLKNVIYNNPSTLEANVCHYAREHNLVDCGMTYRRPFILSFPLNMVQEVAANESLGVSVEMLNNLFLEGKRLDYIIPKDIKEFQQYPREVKLLSEGKEEILSLQK